MCTKKNVFDSDWDIVQPKGNDQIVWVHKDRLLELLDSLSDELGNECDDEIMTIFPIWNYHIRRKQ